jgi:uncharacterized protein YabE (DUF348 family)/3D (Asp-Asp-Asp) domain-containing protein
VVNVVSRAREPAALLNLAGVEAAPGDVFARTKGEIRLERAAPAIVEVDGRSIAWRTRAATVGGLLDELAVTLGPKDHVLFNGIESPAAAARPIAEASAAPPADGAAPSIEHVRIVLTVRRAVPITVVEDDKPIALQSSRQTLAAALQEAGITLGPADQVYPAPTAPVVAGMEVRIKHAKAINLRTGSGSRVIYTHQPLLKDALAEAGLSFGADDRVEPALDAAVTNGMSARLVRVAGRSLVERDEIEHKTVFRPDENLSGSAYRIVRGRDGVRLREYRVVIEDGVEREKNLVREWMEPEVVDTVIYYPASTIQATGIAPESLNAVATERVYATWYNAASSGKAPTDPAYGITRMGVPVTRGVVAVDPAVIPLGTRLYIPGYGFAVASDTGGGIIGHMIDLGYPDGAPVDWRTGWVDIYILGS